MPRAASNDLFYKLPQAACIIDRASMTIVDWNLDAEELLNLSHGSEPVHLSTRIQSWNKDKFFEAFARDDFDSPELRGVTGITNGPVNLDILASATEWKGRQVYLAVFADATVRVRLEEQLRQAQKMEAVGMLAGGIAHDFNNLLTIISGYGHMLATSVGADENNRSAAEQVIKASDRAAALTRQLLSFSRRQVVQNKLLDLNGVVQGMTPMLNRIIGENIRLRIEQGSDLGRMRADSGQIEQIVMNLVVNARDAMPDGGRLVIQTSNAELDDHYVGRHLEARPGSYVMLAVSDTGIGMDAATREKIFEPFFTTKAEGKGTGLGLSMVYGIVKRTGGTVDVYSEPGQGTAIKVYFPRSQSADAGASPDVMAKQTAGSETVLLVEDEEAVRAIVRAALEALGYRMLVAASGEEALELAKSNSGPIDLLITDVVLPGINGREVARRFHKKRPEAAVLFTSGYTDISINESSEAGKQVHFIGKPFTPAALAQRVRELLDAKRQPLKMGVPGHEVRADQGE